MKEENISQDSEIVYVPTEKDYAYIAGLLEAEGSFCIAKLKQKSRRRYRYATTISVGMKERPAIDFLVKVFPTAINQTSQTYFIRYASLKTKEILNKIYKYLTFKRSQANILLQIIDYKEEYGGTQKKMSNTYEELKNLLSKTRKIIESLETPCNYPIFSAPQEITLSYLAGIIDGEGSFGIYSSDNGTVKASFSIWMTNLASIKLLSQVFGGNIQFYVRGTKTRPAFVVRLASNLINGDLDKFLSSILPYLKLKKEQALLCQQFIQQRHTLTPLEKQSFVTRCKKAKHANQVGTGVKRPIRILTDKDLLLIKRTELKNQEERREKQETITRLAKENRKLISLTPSIAKLISYVFKNKFYPNFEHLYSKNYRNYDFSLISLRDYIQEFLSLNSLKWEEFNKITICNDAIFLPEYEFLIRNAIPKWTFKLQLNSSKQKIGLESIILEKI